MKKRVFQSAFFLMLAAFLMVPTMQSCKSKAAAQKAPDDEVLLQTYCSEEDNPTTTQYFRASYFGESTDQVMSKKKAYANAKAKLAGDIESILKVVTDNYAQSQSSNNVEDVQGKLETISREVTQQKLNGIRTICEKQTRTKAGTYKTYVTIELMGNEITNAMNDRLSQDKKLEIDFDKAQFQKELEKEMENYPKKN